MKRTVSTTLLLVLALSVIARCGGTSAALPSPTPESNAAVDTKVLPTDAQIPPACALLTAADVDRISGYSGGVATPLALGEGATQCTTVTGAGALTVQVTVAPGVYPLLPGEKTTDLEGGAQGVSSLQTPFDQDWMTKINFPSYSVSMLATGSAVVIDPDKKVASLTKADGSTITLGEAYEAFARTIAHSAAGGVSATGGVVQLGDPCTALTLDDVKSLAPDSDISGPDYQDTTFGVKQCIYRFVNPQAPGFITLAFITQPQFDADMKNREPVSGIGDAAGIGANGTLVDFRKGDTFVYMTFAGTNTEGFKQLAQKIAAHLGP